MVRMRFMLWRRRTVPAFYNWRGRRRTKKALVEKFGRVPAVGDVVEDCRSRDLRIAKIDPDLDTVILEDGSCVSLLNCCDWPK